MSYTQARLDEAVLVIREDNKRLRQEREAKYALTHYRDDFNLRRTSRLGPIAVRLYHDGDSELDDDDEYKPKGLVGKRRQRNKKATNETSTARNAPKVKRSAAKHDKHNTDAKVNANVFLTLGLTKAKSKTVMAELADQHSTTLDSWLTGSANFECLKRHSYMSGRLDRMDSPDEIRAIGDELSRRKEKGVGTTVEETSWGVFSGSASPTPWVSHDDHNDSDADDADDDAADDAAADDDDDDDDDDAANTDESDGDGDNDYGNDEHDERLSEMSNDDDYSDQDNNVENPYTQNSYKKPLRQSLSPSLKARGISRDTAILIEDEEDEDSFDHEASDTIIISDTDQDSTDIKAADIFDIRTPFAHPINFKYQRQPCDFCKNYRFGIVGYGLRTVTVTIAMTSSLSSSSSSSSSSSTTAQKMSTNDNNGCYIELGNGHAKTHPSTNMCVSCALNRMMITRCLKHELTRILGAPSIHDIDAKAYGLDLIDQTRIHNHDIFPPSSSGVKHICSICPYPATYRCVKPQTRDRGLNLCINPNRCREEQLASLAAMNHQRKRQGLVSQLELKPAIQGCGLLLCERCHDAVQRDWGRLVKESVVEKATQKGGPGMVRGDMEFLFRDGSLWKSYNPT